MQMFDLNVNRYRIRLEYDVNLKDMMEKSFKLCKYQ